MKALRQGYIDDEGVGHIPLTRNMWAMCDAHWFHKLSQFNWQAHRDPKNENSRWYAVRNIRLPNGKCARQFMARVIMGVTDPKVLVDHKDHEATLDNREANLRIATYSQNQQNMGLPKHNTSGFKGATWHKRAGKWESKITFRDETIYLGLFSTAVEAAAVYNYAAKRLFGDFAVLNDFGQVQDVEHDKDKVHPLEIIC
jgi:hypothetical protein